jgi:DNA-binding Lrp family transcriptional regulator
VTSRLARLPAAGVISAIVPQVDPAGSDYDLAAFCPVDILQNVTGDHDLHLRVVARSGQDLQGVLDQISQVPGVARTPSSLALRTHGQGRTLPLLHAALARQSA